MSCRKGDLSGHYNEEMTEIILETYKHRGFSNPYIQESTNIWDIVL